MLIHIFSSIFLSLVVSAEYRVYQYMVAPKDPGRAPSSHVITSTLDPVSYIAYHGGNDALRVDLLKTWMCKGHTGKKDICSDPLKKLQTDKENP